MPQRGVQKLNFSEIIHFVSSINLALINVEYLILHKKKTLPPGPCLPCVREQDVQRRINMNSKLQSKASATSHI